MNKRITSILLGFVMGCAVVANAMPVFADDHVCVNNLTPLLEIPATCTTDGVKEHYECSCDKLYWDDDAFDEITDLDSLKIPALGHDWAGEWSSDETNHWHACTRCDEKYDLDAHTPDHPDGSTTEYAVTCEECGYLIEPQLKQIEIPFQLIVEKTGEKDPGPETFQFLVEDFNAPVDFTIVKDTIETNGENTYTGSLIFTMKESLGNLEEGFVIRQVIGSAAGWTYDETRFSVEPLVYYDPEDYEQSRIEGWEFCRIDENGEPEYNNPLREISFTNRYYAANPTLPYLPPRPEKPTAPEEIIEPEVPLEPEAPMEPSVPTAPAIPTEAPTPDVPEEIKQPPQTGDNSNSALWISLLLVSGSVAAGTAIASQKRKSKDK